MPSTTDLTVTQLRALRDIADGRIAIYVGIWNYDESTGESIDPPVRRIVGADRQVPGLSGPWWTPLLEADLIAFPPDGAPLVCVVTESGYRLLAANR